MFSLDNLVIVFFIFVYSVLNSLITTIILKHYYYPQQQQTNNNGMFTKEDVDRLLENHKNEINLKISKEKAILTKENEEIQIKLKKKQIKSSKLKDLLLDYENKKEEVLKQPLAVPDSLKLRKALEENAQLKKKTLELEESNSQLYNQIQVQVKNFNDLRVHAESKLTNASEQLEEIKKVAKKQILELNLKLKDAKSKLALKKKQQQEENKCYVCMEDMETDSIATIDCNHKFCFDCMDTWHKIKNTCPLCRARFYTIKRVGHDPIVVGDVENRAHEQELDYNFLDDSDNFENENENDNDNDSDDDFSDNREQFYHHLLRRRFVHNIYEPIFDDYINMD
ncbi:hypothetical protein DICPUDRAFT_155373 [Dictyostelium purpureum]|uniref:RING-type domain-containing protein n=1 Tax=Dictyostelium purpureum TaxID=5786 RepID=F0ZTU0_DICPU|nr:uncharacterized protein DICPUDRAFT_155373 [Dictyostelium purpureum]EGC32619.1 hypothetical protein DICPUDRAFT_155373 [Dictyostelium purpureum]|eukprot:XP_003290834.1 hypothetical protein DICPUDRAFT_155373 [Dictyostelium purpureum]